MLKETSKKNKASNQLKNEKKEIYNKTIVTTPVLNVK
jgi:hypothetical protein